MQCSLFVLLSLLDLLSPCVGSDEAHLPVALVIGGDETLFCAESADVSLSCEALHFDPALEYQRRISLELIDKSQGTTHLLIAGIRGGFAQILVQKIDAGQFTVRCSFIDASSGDIVAREEKGLALVQADFDAVRSSLGREECVYEKVQGFISALGWSDLSGASGQAVARESITFLTHANYQFTMNSLCHAVESIRADRGEGVFVVQIGANDGRFVDPMYDYIMERGWKGVLVEPLKDVFDKLVQTYDGVQGLVLENVAIADIGGGGTVTMMRVPQHKVEECMRQEDCRYANGLGTLNFGEHSHATLKRDGVEEEVTSSTLHELLERNHVSQLDVFQVDAEGSDARILLSLDLERYRPLLIQIEVDHLRPAELRSVVIKLSNAGYRMLTFGGDLAAYLQHDLTPYLSAPRH